MQEVKNQKLSQERSKDEQPRQGRSRTNVKRDADEIQVMFCSPPEHPEPRRKQRQKKQRVSCC